MYSIRKAIPKINNCSDVKGRVDKGASPFVNPMFSLYKNKIKPRNFQVFFFLFVIIVRSIGLSTQRGSHVGYPTSPMLNHASGKNTPIWQTASLICHRFWTNNAMQQIYAIFTDRDNLLLKFQLPICDGVVIGVLQRTSKEHHGGVMFNRPGIAGAVLQSAPIDRSFSSKSSKHHKSKTIRSRDLKFWHNVHHQSCVGCHMSCVKCIFLVFFYNLVELVGEGLLSTGPTPSSFCTYA